MFVDFYFVFFFLPVPYRWWVCDSIFCNLQGGSRAVVDNGTCHFYVVEWLVRLCSEEGLSSSGGYLCSRGCLCSEEGISLKLGPYIYYYVANLICNILMSSPV